MQWSFAVPESEFGNGHARRFLLILPREAQIHLPGARRLQTSQTRIAISGHTSRTRVLSPISTFAAIGPARISSIRHRAVVLEPAKPLCGTTRRVLTQLIGSSRVSRFTKPIDSLLSSIPCCCDFRHTPTSCGGSSFAEF